MNNRELLGARIKELRKEKKIKQEFLAEKLGIEPRQLSKLETGKHYPSFETIIGILKTLDISFEELVNFEHLQDKKIIREEISKLILGLDDEKLKITYKFIKSLTA